MYPNDEIRLRHMVDAAREAISFAEGKKLSDLDTDRQLALALTKSIEIIGEAATHISEPFKQRHSNIPWPQIVGMRNRLIHAYFDVDSDILWATVTKNLPALLAELEKIAPPEADQ